MQAAVSRPGKYHAPLCGSGGVSGFSTASGAVDTSCAGALGESTLAHGRRNVVGERRGDPEQRVGTRRGPL
jgi:hypothetical protein